MHRQARKLLDLVNQLLDFPQGRSRATCRCEPRSGRRGALSGGPLSRCSKLQARGAAPLTYVTGRCRPSQLVLYFDRSKLEIILTNLLANAFKYTPIQGRVALRWRPRIVGQTSRGAKRCTDRPATHGQLLQNARWPTTGPGIRDPPSWRDYLSTPYYQASHPETRRIMGTGIGLSLARQFVPSHHRGSLGVASTEVNEAPTFERAPAFRAPRTWRPKTWPGRRLPNRLLTSQRFTPTHRQLLHAAEPASLEASRFPAAAPRLFSGGRQRRSCAST